MCLVFCVLFKQIQVLIRFEMLVYLWVSSGAPLNLPLLRARV